MVNFNDRPYARTAYNDPDPVYPLVKEYDDTQVSPEVKNYVKQLSSKMSGVDTREVLRRAVEIIDLVAGDAKDTSVDTKARQDDVENRFDDQMAGNTDIDEVIDARRPEGGEAYPTLRRRLDEEHQKVTAQLAQNTMKLNNIMVNAKTFGAQGDGVTDDTESIQNAINFVNEMGGGTVYIPYSDSPYMIRSHVENTEALNYLRDEGGLKLLSNVVLRMQNKNTILKAIPNNKKAYNIVRVFGDSNVSIIGGHIKGERHEHSGSEGEYGYGISLQGASDITIDGTIISDCWGDGINIQVRSLGDGVYEPCKNVHIKNVLSDSNRRQGMSIEGLINGLIEDSTFTGTGGILPEAGVDIEPWSDTNPVHFVRFNNCTFEKNKGSGLVIMGKNVKKITIDNCFFNENEGDESDLPITSASQVSVFNSVLDRTVITRAKNVLYSFNNMERILINASEDIDFIGNTIKNKTISQYRVVFAMPNYQQTPSKRITLDSNHIYNDIRGIEEVDFSTLSGLASGSLNTDITVKNNRIENGRRPTRFLSNNVTVENNHFLNFQGPIEYQGSGHLYKGNIYEGVGGGHVFHNYLDSEQAVIIDNVAYTKPRSIEDRRPELDYPEKTDFISDSYEPKVLHASNNILLNNS